MTKSSISISIVIPVYNGGESFAKCLASIKTSLRQPDEVIVVSDGDSDNSWQVAQAFGAKVLRLPAQGGPARARNVGANAASGDILFFMDADVTLHPNTLSLIEEQFEQSSLAALIGSYDDAPGADNFLSQYRHKSHQLSGVLVGEFVGRYFKQLAGLTKVIVSPVSKILS